MMTTLPRTIGEAATAASAMLRRGERKADGLGYVLLPAKDAPEWFVNLCRDAHDDGTIMPDDWRYEFIGDALSAIADYADHAGDDIEDHEVLDHLRESFDGCYVYTAQQTAWLHSRTDRYCFCDEAAEDYGGECDTTQRLALGMLREFEGVAHSVLTSLQAVVAEAEAEELA